jgi:HK97 family phage major capsid protein
VNRYEKQKAAIERAIAEKITEYQAVYAKADEEDREPSQDERLDIEGCLKRIEILKKERSEADANIDQMRRVEELGRDLGPAIPGNTSGGGVSMRVESEPQDRVFRSAQKSLGDAFIESKGYKDAINDYRSSGGRFREGFSTGAVTLDMKGTLLEGAAGGGGALAATVPQVIPGAVETLFQKLTFADLVLGGQASTNSVRYVVEGTATSGAAGVAEGGTKPESTVGLTTTDEPIKKIATLLPVSEEMLEDAPAIQSYINGRLSLFVRIEEERQLLRGTSGGNEVQGMLTTRNVPVFGTASAAAGDDFATKIFKAANSMRGSAFVEPEWVVMHPSDWQTIRLAKDGAGGTVGQFFGGGPFVGPYGGPQGPVGVNSQVSGATDTVWNMPAYITAAIGAGTALIGTRASAQVWRRGGLSVDATNSHSNYFQLNLVAIRAEERLGLAVYRPRGFVELRFNT